MQVVILAAGRGVRMGGLTEHTPKPMLPILGKPLLEWKLATLPESIDEVIVTIGYLGDQIEKYFGKEWNGKKMHYVYHEKLDGTGGAIDIVHKKGLLSFPVLVMMGDDLYLKEDLEQLMKHDLAVLACEMKDSSQFGVLQTDENGRLIRIVEKPHPIEYTLVNTGAYILNDHFFEYPLVQISEKEFGLPQTLVQMRDTYDIAVETTTTWFPIGTPEALETAQTKIKKFL
ncbi:MAG: nucleotidyltransferase family protein [Candidatus Moraniibacteriota bacterium]